MMQKVYGSPKRQDGLYKVGRNKWELIYGFGKDDESNDTGWNWRERFDHYPTIEEIKATIIETINAQTHEKILTSFEWNGLKVWLSEQNQANYQSIAMSETVAYPLRLKINEEADGTPIYHTFEDAQTFREFQQAGAQFALNCLIEGWREKDGIDWASFKR